MKPATPLCFAALAAAFVATFPATAFAQYCRTKACDTHPAFDDVWQTEPDPPCDRDVNGCLLEGQPLYWPKSCFSFSVQKDGSRKQGIDFDTAHSVIQQAFDIWLGADCGGATPSFRVDDLSPVTCGDAQYNQSQGNANIFMFRDSDWPYVNSEDTLALTTITYNTENAQIYDADVELNSAMEIFTVTDNPHETVNDLLSVVTHEAGHFLGLSHDASPLATMWSRYNPGSLEQRSLHTTDIEGICAVYPPGEDLPDDACLPRHGFARDCATEEDTGCGVSAGSGSGTGSALLLALTGLVLVGRRRRKTAR